MEKEIIGLAGRCRGGKTELANICQKLGYEKVSFATPLKNLVAMLIGGDIDKVNEWKNVQNWQKVISPLEMMGISKMTDIPFEFVEKTLKGVVFHNTREMLQIIGTDLIRTFNNEWHVEKTLEYIKNSPNDKFVIDDVRFPNERNMIEENNGICWFVLRPNISTATNHVSETSLKWQDFDYLIVNNSNLNNLLNKWENFLTDYKTNVEKRNTMLYDIYSNVELINDYNTENFFIPKEEFTYLAHFLNPTEIPQILGFDDKTFVKIKYNNKEEIITNTFMIEDLKKFVK